MPEEPRTELPEKEVLIGVFLDMHMAEVPMSRVPLSKRDSIGLELRKRIARGHGMTADEMQDVIHAVQTDVDLASEIYDSVEVRLKRMQKKGEFE